MQRLRDYGRFVLWSSGIGYVALWALTLWTLYRGAAVFGQSGVCRPQAIEVLFYWVCDPSTALGFVATIANAALTITVWAPVYIAAATVRGDALFIAVPILVTHMIGLPAALLVMIRSMLALFALGRRLLWR
jgi:hypothetical protein